MPGKVIEAGDFEIRHIGMADVSKILKDVYTLLEKNDYKPKEGSFKQKSSGPGEWYIEVEHSGEKKVSPYIVYRVTVNYFFMDTKDVEVKKEGKTLKVQKTRCIIKIYGEVVTDPEDKFNTKLTKFLRHIYDKYIIKNQLYFYNAHQLENFLFQIRDVIQSNYIR